MAFLITPECRVDTQRYLQHYHLLLFLQQLLILDHCDVTSFCYDVCASFRCMMMALVHDLAEALAGDITPHDNVSATDKHALELSALQKILASLGPDTSAAELILSVFGC